VNWTGLGELKAQVMRLWERGELLRDVVTARERFPLRLSLSTPGSGDITERFDLVRSWADQLALTKALRIEWQEIRHRVQGTQRLPLSVWIDTLDGALGWIGKRRELERFAAQVAATRETNEALIAWMAKRPLTALELHAEWEHLLAVVNWFMLHPRPGIYLRQVDVAGVHTKFIEKHRSILTEMLDLVLPAEAIDMTKTGINQFAARYGLLEKPIRIRFRILDADINLINGCSFPDIALDADSFGSLNLGGKNVFICENETNFLALPQLPNAIVIFGAGYGWQALAGCEWLKHCSIYYWGDIDTHGFGILNQLRSYFEHVDSFLMDRATLKNHQIFWGVEDKPLQADLHRLTSEENNLYNDLRDNRIRTCLRLEQEHVSYGWLCARLQNLFKAS